MTVGEILNAESKEIEYKEMIPRNSRNYTKTAVAYANCAGGLLIFGVEDGTWKVTGIPQDTIFEASDGISNAIIDSCEPMIDFDIKYWTIEGKTIIIVQVYPGKNRPYFLKKEGKPDGVYIRVPGSTRAADDFMVKELELEGTNKSYDKMIAVGETVTEEEIDKLCDTMYQYALSRCLTTEEKQSMKRVTKRQLQSWGLLQEKDGKIYPTNGFLLLSPDRTQETSVQCGVFKGTTRAVFVDKKEYNGPIYEQIDEAYQFVLRNIRMGAEFGGLLRRDVYELPIDSIRELIANAVSHRSYLDAADVQVALYDDRLEITSPGMLIGGLTIEEMKKGYSRPRNKGIMRALAYMKVVERWGSGIPRLYEDCERAGLREPELSEQAGCFRVNMFRNTELMEDSEEQKKGTDKKEQIKKEQKKGTEKKEQIKKEQKKGTEILERTEKIWEMLCENPNITQSAMMEKLGISRKKVQLALEKLIEEGRIERVGSDRSGSWKIRRG